MARRAAEVRTAIVGVVGRLLTGGTVRVVTDAGVILSEHPITGVTDPVGPSTWATVGPSVATGAGRADHVDILSGGALLISGGSLSLDFPDIDEGADVLLDPIRLEA